MRAEERPLHVGRPLPDYKASLLESPVNLVHVRTMLVRLKIMHFDKTTARSWPEAG